MDDTPERALAALEKYGGWYGVLRALEDAERYRWLRAIPNEVRADHDWNPGAGGWDAPILWRGINKPGNVLQGSDLDAAIDAAMQGANA